MRVRELILVVFGAAAGLLAAEAGIRLLGRAYYAHRLGHRSHTAPSRRVLCVGDSFTFGMGAPKGRSYPEQLEELLHEDGRNRDIAVLNKGIPGLNSSQLAKNIGAWLDKYRPELLLVLIGDNNPNLTGSHFHLIAPWGERTSGGFLQRTDIRLLRLRAYRQIRLAWILFRFRTSRGYSPDPRSSALAASGRASFERGKYPEAAVFFERAIKADPKNAAAHAGIGEAYFQDKRYQEAKKSFARALQLDPFEPNAVGSIGAIPVFSNPGRVEAHAKDFLEYDLERIAEAAKARGVTLILQGYPSPNPFTEEVPEAVARRLGLSWVDHSETFAPLIRAGRAREFLSGDSPNLLGSHPNENGYRLMARTLAEKLQEIAALSPPPGELLH